MAEEPDEEHEHDALRFLKSDADEVTLGTLRVLHPYLADNLLLARRFDALNAEEKGLLEESQRAVEEHAAWMPGYHAQGDRCATCETPVPPLFSDRFESGSLPYGAFVDDIPVHARKECIEGFAARTGPRSPQARDRLRREFTLDRARPTARLTQFFRADALTRPPFGLEDWANSVAEANQGKLDKTTQRDIERLVRWVHKRLYHAH